MKGTHKLFRAMVTMGGSLALGCGGISARNEVDPGGGEGGTSGAHESPGAGGAAGGAASTGSATGTGNSTSEGGTSSTGGTGISIPTGGTGGTAGTIAVGGTGTGASGAIEPGPFACPPEHWNCSAVQPVCSGSARGWNLPNGCVCDPSRPTTAADCPPGEGLVCRKATNDAQGRTLTRTVPFECSCAPITADCSVCEAFFPQYGDGLSCEQLVEEGETASNTTTLCGCAIVYLR